MEIFGITPDDEQQLRRELFEEESAVLRYASQASQATSDIIEELSAVAPHAPGEIIFPLALEVQSGTMGFETAAQTAVQSVQYMGQKTIERQEEPKSTWDKISGGFYEGLKSTAKWGFAGLEFLPQTVTNLVGRAAPYISGPNALGEDAADYYTAPDTSRGFWDGFFTSTDLGTLITGAESGNGFFIGEQAKQQQEEKARAYRGTIAGEAFTLGRGFAQMFVQPDTKPYNIVSGLVDAAAAITVPSVPGAKVIGPAGRAVGLGDQTETALRGIRRAAGAAVGSQRSRLAGIVYSGRPHVDRKSVFRWLDTKDGTKVIDRLTKVRTLEEAMDVFPNATGDFWTKVRDINDAGEMKRLLRGEIGGDDELLGLGVDRGLQSLDDFKIGRRSDVRRAMLGIQDAENLFGRVGVAALKKTKLQSSFARQFATVPGREMVLFSDDVRDITQTVKNARDYMKLLRVADDERERVLALISKSLFEDRELGGIQTALRELDEVLIKALTDRRGYSKEASRLVGRLPGRGTKDWVSEAQSADEKFLRQVLGKYRTETGEYQLFGTIDEATGKAMMPKGFRFTREGSFTVEAGGDLASATAHIPSEMRRFAGYMPDARKLRRASSKYRFLWMKHASNPDKWGDPRAYTALLDKIQQDIWRPATLMTGGYMFRNMLESVVRQMAAPGVQTGPLHPLEWMRAVAYKRVFGDVNGLDFADDAAEFGRRTSREFLEAQNATLREANDIVDIQRAAHRSGHYEILQRPDDLRTNQKYARGVANELRLMANTSAGRMAAAGYSRDDIIDWLAGRLDETSDFLDEIGAAPGDGPRFLKMLNKMWENKRILPQGEDVPVRGSIGFIDENGAVDFDNVATWVDEVLLKRLDMVTGGNDSLKEMIARSVRDGKFRDAEGNDVKAFIAAETGPYDVEAYDFTEEMLAEINRLASDADVKLPQWVKAPVDINDVMFGKTGSTPLNDAWRKTVDHFFGHVFGKKEAYLNRSPVFRRFYYRRIDDLTDEMSSETAGQIVLNIQNNAIRQVEERVRLLERAPVEDGRRVWNGRAISDEKYNKLLKDARDELADAQGVVRGTARTLREVETDFNYLMRRKPDKNGMYNIKGDMVTKDEYDIMVDRIRRQLDIAKSVFKEKYAERYVGSADLWRRLKERAAGGHMDGLTVEQLDIASKAFALEETKKVFYNAAEKSNLADTLRIAVPFGSAWAEMTKAYYKQVLTKPNRIKNMEVTVQGFRDMDPDNDGKGFVWRDPVSGEMMFNYPFDSALMPLITAGAVGVLGETLLRGPRGGVVGAAAGAIGGEALRRTATSRLGPVEANLAAPLKSLSMSFQVLPGIGPLVQIPLNEMLGNKPGADKLMEIVSPYGAPELGISGFAPAWLRKVYEGFSADPSSDRMYADMRMDAYRALYATGDYDNTNAEDLQRLRDDASSVAASMLAYRGLAQYLGPVRGQVQFNIPTKFDGDITVDGETYSIDSGYISNVMLSATFRAMQEEDYENAVSDFLRTFGPDMMLYTSGKTKSKVEGLDASAMFGDWERNNREVTERFPTVYGYFGPIGTQFDLQTYLRQIEEGKREKISSPQELQADAEAVVGKALYIDRVRMFPTNPTDDDEDELRLYRDTLEAQLPGFQFAPLNINERPQIIDQLVQAAYDPLLQNNPVAIGARAYLDYRQEAIDEAVRRAGGIETQTPLGPKANEDLRAWLRDIGDRVVAKYPEFERLYTRVFFDEVDVLQ